MKGSGGWSDSLTCSIGGCRCRCGYRGSGSRTSRCSSPFLLLSQRSLLPCLSQPMFLLQFQSEKSENRVATLIKKIGISHCSLILSPFHPFSHFLNFFPPFFTYRSCITGDIRPSEAGGGGSMSGLYLNPYRGYDGSPGNNGGLIIPHRSRYICSSNLKLKRAQNLLNFIINSLR